MIEGAKYFIQDTYFDLEKTMNKKDVFFKLWSKKLLVIIHLDIGICILLIN